MEESTAGMSEDMSRLTIDPGPMARDQQTAISAPAEGVMVFDITEKFVSAASTLSPGALVKDGYFTLFESVGALEIMDPKMDSGCPEAEETLDDVYDVCRPLLPEEVLGIIDQLLCHEMAWHLGYPLSQTLFTNVYVEAILTPTPATIDDADFVRRGRRPAQQDPMHSILRAYCLGLLSTCGWVNERIKAEHFYEKEEDFVTNTYSRTLLEQLDGVAIQQHISDVRTSLAASIVPATTATAPAPDSLSPIPPDLANALDLRLQLRQHFIAAVAASLNTTSPDEVRRPWQLGFDILARISATHALSRAVPEAFSARLQRKLASTMPPRPIVQLGFDEAFVHLARLFSDAIEVVDVLNYTNSQSLQTFVTVFQAKKPQPLVFVRTMFQSFLFNDMVILGTRSIRQVLDDDFSIVVLPASPHLDRANDEIEAVQDPRWTVARQMEQFRQRAAQPFLDVLRTFCQNRCRVRRTLCHVVQDWDALQADAEDIDQVIQAQTHEQPLALHNLPGRPPVDAYHLPLSSWAYLNKLKQMEWIVQLGFELEIYQVDEMAGMYWYLNFLARTRLDHIRRIRAFTDRSIDETRAAAGASTPPRPLNPETEAQFARALNFSKLSILDAASTWELSDALSCLFAILFRLSLLVPPPRPYSSNVLRYELRMRPFSSVGLPALPSFDEFRTGSLQPEVPMADLLVYAERAAGGARARFEQMSRLGPSEAFCEGSHSRWLAGVKNGLKASIATGIAVVAVKRAVEAVGDVGASIGELKIRAEVPTPEKAYHEWWITPKIIPVR